AVFYDFQIQLGARQLSAQPRVLGLNLRDRSLHRYRSTRSCLELACTAELDPIPQTRLRNAQSLGRLVTSDRFAQPDRLYLELIGVLPIRYQFLLAHITLRSSEIYTQSDVRETRAGSRAIWVLANGPPLT